MLFILFTSFFVKPCALISPSPVVSIMIVCLVLKKVDLSTFLESTYFRTMQYVIA